MKLFQILWFAASLLFISDAHALVSPIGLSLVPPVELPPASFTITGLSVNLWGSHQNVYGLDVGVVNSTTQNFGGLQLGGLNMNTGTATIALVQAAVIGNVNVNKTQAVGIQAAALFNSNQAESSIYGIQFAAINLNPALKMVGIQAGLYNTARDVYGFQIGLVNRTENLHGLQIGLLNFNTHGLFAIAPILNVGF